jgi:hypothetical protein
VSPPSNRIHATHCQCSPAHLSFQQHNYFLCANTYTPFTSAVTAPLLPHSRVARHLHIPLLHTHSCHWPFPLFPSFLRRKHQLLVQLFPLTAVKSSSSIAVQTLRLAIAVHSLHPYMTVPSPCTPLYFMVALLTTAFT